jgi:hypothetical protein
VERLKREGAYCSKLNSETNQKPFQSAEKGEDEDVHLPESPARRSSWNGPYSQYPSCMQISNLHVRDVGLGTLMLFTDETILEILGLLDAKDLGRLAAASRALYIFSNQDSLWRALVLLQLNGIFSFNGCWKSTYISAHWPMHVLPQVPLKVSNFYSDYLFRSWLCASLEMKREWLEVDNGDRRNNLSLEDFIACYEESNKPVLLSNDALVNWPAMKKWEKGL